MRRTFITPLFALTLLMIGCEKDSYNVIDKTYFFTIVIKGKTYASYGWYQNDYPEVSNGAPFEQVQFSALPGTTDTLWIRRFSISDKVTNYVSPKSVGNCNGYFTLTRVGSALGEYKVIKGPEADHQFYDLDGKRYFIDQGTERFDLKKTYQTGTSGRVFEGEFTCNLWESNGSTVSSIPAYGSFRVRSY